MRSNFPVPVFIHSAYRTPIGRFGGSLKTMRAAELAASHLKSALKADRAEVPVDGVLLGHARQAGAGPNPARQAALFAGLPLSTPAITVNQACASGLTAVVYAAQQIALKRGEHFWAGGVESMSNTPYFLMNARFGARLGHGEVTDGMIRDGFYCPMSEMLMGETVQRFIAYEMGISRQEQDIYALRSHERAHRAWESGAFQYEVLPVEEVNLLRDEHVRSDATMESLSRLPPVFDREKGTLTAGNSSGITDGASFLRLSADPSGALAEILDYEIVALEPQKMGLGPVPAIQKLIERAGIHLDAIDQLEINEAFAAQVIACQKLLKIDGERLNPKGGAIALGHPIGCSGARVLTTLVHGLRDRPGALGVAALCVSGGQGIALLIKRATTSP